MEGYQLTSLEDVFLKLCIKQNNQVNQLALHFKVEIDFKNIIGCITQWIIQWWKYNSNIERAALWYRRSENKSERDID